MEISKGIIRVETKQNVPPSDIEIIGLGMDGYLVIKYKVNEKIMYAQWAPDRKIQNYLFFEIINYNYFQFYFIYI